MTTKEIANMQLIDIIVPIVAIVIFGPISSDMGMRPATFYQVTIDPSKISPCGNFIRLGNNTGDEIIGWQKIDCLTIVSILGDYEGSTTTLNYHQDLPIQFNIDSNLVK